MDFCDICHNMLYFKDNGRVLQKYCKNCRFSREMPPGQSFKVASTLYSEDDLLYMQYKNQYLRYDPALPRVRDPKILCPSQGCTEARAARGGEPGAVLYVKYHPVNMRYFFQCEDCGTSWRKE